MRTNIKYTRVANTPDIERHIASCMQTIEKLIDEKDDSALAQVELAKTSAQKTGDIYRAEINMHIAGADFFAFSEKSDFMSALDTVRDEILRKMKTRKDKRVSFMRRGGRKIKDYLKGITSIIRKRQ
ncbi:MAG: HPF/RaiA family ribosome-associated protein [Candidatus Pacebacteria bacterium]|nr:HPF/RaiA family ribosome-associated protein [Candidatus Paceibacterota bacterium]MDD5357331.1 HPF/RaiA family ribosome-associated protein [Candidatus Paceibacterota bacterium]